MRQRWRTLAARRLRHDRGEEGKSLDAIMRQTLHKSERVARSYVRQGGIFDDNAAVGIV